MKKFISLLIVVFCLSLTTGCDKTEDFYAEDSLELKSANNSAQGLDQDRYVIMKDYDNLKVHYRIIGKGPIDMVFIPGWTNPLTVYTKQFDYFRDKARCIYIDLPGTGLSDAPTPNTPLGPILDGPEYTMELMADAVYTVIKKEGLHQFVGVGFSMGPKVLGMFERNYPGVMYKLVTLDGGFDPWPTDELARTNLMAAREVDYLAQLEWNLPIKQFLAGYLVPPGSSQELLEWVKYFWYFPSDVLANTNYHAGAENANEPVGWTYRKLCFYQNPNPNMDKVNWIYPNNTVYSFPGGGHCIQWVFHEEINPIIWEFVKDRPGKKY